MKKLHRILTDLEQGKISSDHAEQQVLDLFDVSVSFEHGEKLCDCPECGAEIVYGLSKETMLIVKNRKMNLTFLVTVFSWAMKNLLVKQKSKLFGKQLFGGCLSIVPND